MAQREIQVTIDQFFRALKDSNPFAKNRVTEVGDADVDVPEIHGDAFVKLTRRVERAQQNRVSTGVMLLGGAGMGKSHLLARLSQWADSGGSATVVFLHNVVASAERMGRYLLHATLSTLAGHRPDAYCESELYRLINRALEARLRHEGKTGVPSVSTRLKTLTRIASEGAANSAVVQALREFLQNAIAASSGDARAEQRATEAVEWLAGETIEVDGAEQGRLPATDNDANAADDRLERVFRTLARLAGEAGRVVTLCIDQVDNLDSDQVSALASSLHALLDRTPNLVVITSGVKQSMMSFRENGVIQEAAWDRLGQHVVELQRVDPKQARDLVETRVLRFMQPFRGLPPIAAVRNKESLFPLDGSWLSSRLSSSIEFRPRDIISWAHSRWEEQQDRLDSLGGQHWLSSWPDGRINGNKPPPALDDVIDDAVRHKLAERLQERRLRPEALPPDADNLATLVYGLLVHCQNDPKYSLVGIEHCSPKLRSRIYDLRVRERGVRGAKVSTGIVFITSSSKTSVASMLKHLADDPSPPDHRIVITDEERRPLPLGPRGKDHLAKLTKLGSARFQHIKLTFDEYANLDALAGLLGSARVGDFEVDHPPGSTRPVDEDETLESLHRQSTFLSHPLLREFLTEEPPLEPQLDGHEQKHPVDSGRVRATIQERLAWRLGLTTRELTRLMVDADAKLKDRFDEVHQTVCTVARKMHDERQIFATAQDDAMFLQLLATTR